MLEASGFTSGYRVAAMQGEWCMDHLLIKSQAESKCCKHTAVPSPRITLPAASLQKTPPIPGPEGDTRVPSAAHGATEDPPWEQCANFHLPSVGSGCRSTPRAWRAQPRAAPAAPPRSRGAGRGAARVGRGPPRRRRRGGAGRAVRPGGRGHRGRPAPRSLCAEQTQERRSGGRAAAAAPADARSLPPSLDARCAAGRGACAGRRPAAARRTASRCPLHFFSCSHHFFFSAFLLLFFLFLLPVGTRGAGFSRPPPRAERSLPLPAARRRSGAVSGNSMRRPGDV